MTFEITSNKFQLIKMMPLQKVHVRLYLINNDAACKISEAQSINTDIHGSRFKTYDSRLLFTI